MSEDETKTADPEPEAAEEGKTATEAASGAEEGEAQPARRGKKATVVTDTALGIDRYSCSEGDFTTLADEATVKFHIRSTHG